MDSDNPSVRGGALEAYDRAVAGALAACRRIPSPDTGPSFELVVLRPLDAMLKCAAPPTPATFQRATPTNSLFGTASSPQTYA